MVKNILNLILARGVSTRAERGIKSSPRRETHSRFKLTRVEHIMDAPCQGNSKAIGNRVNNLSNGIRANELGSQLMRKLTRQSQMLRRKPNIITHSIR